MSSTTESKILEIIWDFGGKASIATIAKEARINPEYARLICRALAKHEYIGFVHGKTCHLKGKGKLQVAKMKVGSGNKRKIVIAESPSKFGLGKNKKGRFILDY